MIDVKEDRHAFCGDPQSRISCIEERRGLTEDKLTLFKNPDKEKKICHRPNLHKPEDYIKAGCKIPTVSQKYFRKRISRKCGVVE